MRLLPLARAAFGWDADVAVTEGPRGALGRVWRVDTGRAVYALKEIFADPPDPQRVAAEVAFTRRAAAAGVRVPLSHPDVHGRYVTPAPDGAALRLHDWVDVRPVDLAAAATPGRLGELLARLHRCAPPAAGEPVDDWYERPPPDAAWATPPAGLPALTALVTPADPARLIVCHRDLHPGNVLEDARGELVVLDFDDLGPADPSRELAGALFDWFCDPAPDLAAMRAAHAAYVAAGGPGRVAAPADFTMLVASRLNFLLRQTRIARDPAADPEHRAWARAEIEEALRILPTPAHLAAALAAT
ncbi:phosphotransferase enzyme family protein, partial [Spirilliplanes yamanashiensis]